MNMKNKFLKISYYVIPLVIILCFSLWNFNENSYPKMFGDEYGYWAAAAYFANIDWSEITALNAYYGWGYGIILSFILRLPISSNFCYIIGLILNSILVWGAYCIVYNFCKIIFNKKNDTACCIIGFMGAVMPSVLYYTRYTLSEALLGLLYWELIYAEYKILKEMTYKWLGILAFVDFLLLAVHMRTIGIVIVSICVAVYSTYKSHALKNLKQVGMYIGLCVVGVISVSVVKNLYQSSFRNKIIANNDANTVTGVIPSIMQLFSTKGFYNFVDNFCGRLYSVYTNSFLLGGVCILASLIMVFRYFISKHKIVLFDEVAIVAVLNTLSMIAISSIFMIDNPTDRLDILTYSRYHEFTVGALVVFGVCYLLEERDVLKQKYILIATIVIELILSKIVTKITDYGATDDHLFINNPWLYAIYGNSTEIRLIYFKGCLIVCLVLICVYMAIKFNKYKLGKLICLMVITFNIIGMNYAFETGCLSWSVKQAHDDATICKYIVDNGYENSIYFLDCDNVLWIERLQFMIKDNPIHIISTKQIKDIYDSKAVLITTTKCEEKPNEETYKKVFETSRLEVWKANE